mgnify:CR=1 FL=1
MNLELAIFGIITGFTSGFFGVGGGMVLVPMLLMYGFVMKEAVAISIMQMVFSSIYGSFLNAKKAKDVLKDGIILGIGGSIGGITSAYIVSSISNESLQYLFIAILIFSILRIFYSPAVQTEEKKDKSIFILLFIGFCIGILAMSIGVGGSIVITTIIAYFSPKRMPYIAASLMVAGFLVLWGYEERVREFIRKPFLIYNYMYSNGIRTTDVPYLNKVGILKHAVFLDDSKKVVNADKSNILEVGKSIYQIECRICHTENGINGLKGLTSGWSHDAIRNRLNNLPGGGTPYMPPFVGTESEKDALAAYIKFLNTKGVIK